MIFRLGRAQSCELLTCYYNINFKNDYRSTKTSQMSRHQHLIAVSERGSMCSQQDYSTVLALCPMFIAFDIYRENAIRDHLVCVSRVDRPGWTTGHLPKVPQREMTPGRLLTTSVLIVTFGGNNV